MSILVGVVTLAVAARLTKIEAGMANTCDGSSSLIREGLFTSVVGIYCTFFVQ